MKGKQERRGQAAQEGAVEVTRMIFSKVTWMARATTTVVGLAIMVALVLGVATTAFGANGGNFILGSLNNAATAITKLTGNVNGPAMQVVNTNADANDTALDLRVQSGEAPMRVNSPNKVANLNADRIDNREASSFANGVGGKATNADKLDGLDSAAFAGTGMSHYEASVTLEGCNPKVLASSEISPSRPALIYASGVSVFHPNNGAAGGVMELELRDATDTTRLALGGNTYANAGGNVSLTAQGVLVSNSDVYDSSIPLTPFEVTPGNRYVLRLVGNATDDCSRNTSMETIALSYVLIGK